MGKERRDSLMDLPCFGRSKLIQDRGSRPDRTLSKFLTSDRFRNRA